MKFASLLLITVMSFIFITSSQKAYAATSPTLSGSSGYSVLGGAAITNVGTTTINGAVGVSPGTSITGGTINAGGGIHSNDASAIAAQADTLNVFGALNTGANADTNCIGGILADNTDLTAQFPAGVGPGLYCSAGSFRLTGNLNLTGSGVWVFKMVSTLITSSGSSVTGGDPCNVWWRIGSAATLGTTTSLIGNIVIANSDSVTALNTGATLNGRVLAQSAATVTLSGNTIGLTCAAAAAAATSSTSSTSSTYSVAPCIADQITTVPIIIESRRVNPTSVFISWGPYAGINTFNVRYGLTNGNWLYNTNVTGFSTTINALPANQPIWIQVAATNNCSIGTYGESKFTGAPSLPNTGFVPHENNIPWYIPVGIFAVFSVLFILIQKKYKF